MTKGTLYAIVAITAMLLWSVVIVLLCYAFRVSAGDCRCEEPGPALLEVPAPDERIWL